MGKFSDAEIQKMLDWQASIQQQPKQPSAPYIPSAPAAPSWGQYALLQQALLQAQSTIIELQKELHQLKACKEWLTTPEPAK